MTPARGKRAVRSKRKTAKSKQEQEFSKRLIADIRGLLWTVTNGALPWLSAMVGLPWAAHGVICSFYLNMAKSDHREGGVTFEAAKATNFNVDDEGESPQEF